MLRTRRPKETMRRFALADMKNANLALHPSERSLTKDQTPSLETFSEVVNGDSPISKHYRERIIQKAKFVSHGVR